MLLCHCERSLNPIADSLYKTKKNCFQVGQRGPPDGRAEGCERRSHRGHHQPRRSQPHTGKSKKNNLKIFSFDIFDFSQWMGFKH